MIRIILLVCGILFFGMIAYKIREAIRSGRNRDIDVKRNMRDYRRGKVD